MDRRSASVTHRWFRRFPSLISPVQVAVSAASSLVLKVRIGRSVHIKPKPLSRRP